MHRIKTHRSGKPEIYYVIAGRGYSAVVNHTTLRAAGRLAGRKVLYVGGPNPWTNYRDHKMGQHSRMLLLPGFEKYPDWDAPAFLSSRVFAKCVQDRYKDLVGDRNQALAMRGLVLSVESSVGDPAKSQVRFLERVRNEIIKNRLSPEAGEELKNAALDLFEDSEWRLPDAPIRAMVIDFKGRCDWVYASHLDFCTGPGFPNIHERGKLHGHAHLSDYLSPHWSGPRSGFIEPVYSGNTFLHKRRTKWPEHTNTWVHGGGAVAMLCLEELEKMAPKVIWAGHSFLRVAERFDALEKPALKKRLVKLKRLECDSKGVLHRYDDFSDGIYSPALQHNADKHVAALGHDDSSIGSVFFAMKNCHETWEVFTSPVTKIPCALVPKSAALSRIRVLGGAFLQVLTQKENGPTAEQRVHALGTYFKTLPQNVREVSTLLSVKSSSGEGQGREKRRIPPLIPISAPLIAYANEAFGERNLNLNSAFSSDLRGIGLSSEQSRKLLKLRSETRWGFQSYSDIEDREIREAVIEHGFGFDYDFVKAI